jgi:hypothetical protein
MALFPFALRLNTGRGCNGISYPHERVRLADCAVDRPKFRTGPSRSIKVSDPRPLNFVKVEVRVGIGGNFVYRHLRHRSDLFGVRPNHKTLLRKCAERLRIRPRSSTG